MTMEKACFPSKKAASFCDITDLEDIRRTRSYILLKLLIGNLPVAKLIVSLRLPGWKSEYAVITRHIKSNISDVHA